MISLFYALNLTSDSQSKSGKTAAKEINTSNAFAHY
jgi:hypothetical protein